MKRILKGLILLTGLALIPQANGATVTVTDTAHRASFVEQHNGIFKPLDLKTKNVHFTPDDFNACGHALQRKLKTLTYSCSVEIPTLAKISKLQKQITSQTVTVNFGRVRKRVTIRVSKDARRLDLSTKFDEVGFDFELARFNNEFFGLYAKSAQLIFQQALSKKLKVSVLEAQK